MCSLPAAALAFSIVGTGVAVGGAIQQGRAQSAAAEHAAAVEGANQKNLEFRRTSILAAGARAEKLKRERTEQELSRQRAGFARAGQVVDVEGALFEAQDLAALGEAEALTIRQNTANAAFGVDTQIFQSTQAAIGLRAEASAFRRTGTTSALAQATSGAGTLFGQKFLFNQAKG